MSTRVFGSLLVLASLSAASSGCSRLLRFSAERRLRQESPGEPGLPSALFAECAAPGRADALPSPLRTLHVSTGGNDSADGLTPETAWRSLAHAGSALRAGDQLLLDGVFANEQLSVRGSGTAANPIVVRPRPGSPAEISGASVAVYLPGVSGFVLDGVRITGSATGVYVLGGSDNRFRNLEIRGVGRGVVLSQSSDNRIEDSLFDACGANDGTGECVHILNDSSRNEIRRNRFGRAGSAAVLLADGRPRDQPRADANVVAHNMSDNPWGYHVVQQGNLRRTEVACNLLRSSCASSPGCLRPSVEIASDESEVHHNVIVGGASEAIGLWSYATGAGTFVSANRNHVHHNVVFASGGPSLRLQIRGDAELLDNVVESNLLWGNNRSPDARWFAEGTQFRLVVDLSQMTTPWPAGTMMGNVVRGNFMGAPLSTAPVGGPWMAVFRPAGDPQPRHSLPEAETIYTGISGNSEANPLYVDAGTSDFRLQPGSPATGLIF